jgi:hypothetical protein
MTNEKYCLQLSTFRKADDSLVSSDKTNMHCYFKKPSTTSESSIGELNVLSFYSFLNNGLIYFHQNCLYN